MWEFIGRWKWKEWWLFCYRKNSDKWIMLYDNFYSCGIGNEKIGCW